MASFKCTWDYNSIKIFIKIFKVLSKDIFRKELLVAKIIRKVSPVRKAIKTTANKMTNIGFESSIPLLDFLDCSDFANKGPTFIFEFSTFNV